MNRNRRNKMRATFRRPEQASIWTLYAIHVVDITAPTRAEVEAAAPLIRGREIHR